MLQLLAGLLLLGVVNYLSFRHFRRWDLTRDQQFTLTPQTQGFLKSLRGKRVEDLIFNGGKDAPRANRASAKVLFDNSRRMFNLDFDEVSLERVIHRDSVSEYFINNSLL